MKFIRILCCLTLGLLGSSALTYAEDIDVYSGNSVDSGVPNVLLVLDNAANFSASAANCTYVDGTAPSLNGTAGGIEQCAIYNVVSSLPAGTVNLGLMTYNANNSRDINNANCGGVVGGCLMAPLALMSGSSKANFLAWVKTWTTTGGAGSGYIKANGEATGATMQEAWAYYAGSTGPSGRSYAGVKPAAGCQKNFVIFIGNAFDTSGTPGDGGSGVTATPDGLASITVPSGSYGTSLFSCGSYSMGNHTSSSGLYADEWSRYMYNSDIYSSLDGNQGITTYTVGLLDTKCMPDYPALLTSMAKVGGGKYFATSSYSEIATALLSILNEIQAVNSVFSSASLPVSVNAQGTYLNQIFLGMFRPDASANPRWFGNLKQYEFILSYLDPSKPDPNTATLKLADSTGTSAISTAGTGFITPGAISFWTSKDITNAPDAPPPTGTNGFYVNDQRGLGLAFDSPDGELVEKGGAAQQSRLQNLTVDFAATAGSASNPRRLYTYCPSGSCNATLSNSVNAFSVENAAITDAMLSSIASVSVLSITRAGTTATVTTGANHGYSSGDSITISGATPSDYNGVHNLIVKLSNTSFSFTVTENPPSPATGSFTASIAGSPQAVNYITRSGTLATVNMTAHGFVTGQRVTIAGAVQPQYNGPQTITKIDNNSFSYAIVEGPVSPAGGGTAKTASATANIAAYNGNPNPGVVRAAGSTSVTVSTTANHGFGTSGSVTIAGVKDSTGALVAEYNGTFSYANTGNRTFTYSIAATTPATPATGTITADGSAAPKLITSLVRNGTTVTATSYAHGFLNGETVNIGGTPGTNEGAYIGSFVISGVTSNTFNYSIVTTPASPATGTIVTQKSNSSDRASLIKWVRGENNFGDELGPTGSSTPVTVRPSIHGDVLHSRPAVINYGDSRGMVVYYGANDGVFRAVNGSQTATLTSGTVSVPPGGELWGLVLPDHFGALNRQRVNSPELKLSTTALSTAMPKDYFVDGTPGIYQKLNADGTVNKAVIYLTMRRGGRFIYALDVSTPTSPQMLWKISSADSDFSELGQTWSQPRVTLVNGYTSPVLVFGAGYDPAEDSEPPGTDSMGRGIFVLDAISGALVWKATWGSSSACSGSSAKAACSVSGMNWAIPADISFVDRNNDGKIDRFYAADTGGNVWRVDLEPTSGNTPDKWLVSKLAALGCDTGVCISGATPRKFFFPPNVVSVGAPGVTGSYDAVMVGSGDREHPLDSGVVTDRFYVLKDTATGMNASSTVLTQSSLVNGGVVSGATTYDGSMSGFYISFATGEKAVNAPVTTRGTTFFGTNMPTPPSSTSCSANLGQAKGYALDPFGGTFSSTVFDGGGLPPTPTVGIVTISIPASGSTPASTVEKAFCIGCGGAAGGDTKSALGAGDTGVNVPKSPRRTYWYKQ